MAPQSEMDELLAAWRALAGSSGAEGWRTIPVAHGGPCPLLAGRHFPGNEEALLVGFNNICVPASELLPQGRGFLVSRADLGDDATGRVWVALRRQVAGGLDLFSMMARDIVIALATLRLADESRILHVFLARIRAWQEFMRREGDGVLCPEAEVGLFGELETLRNLIGAGLSRFDGVDAWKAPLDGIQDFLLGSGAIEVKTTISQAGFPARIGSLEQLDDSLARPLFLAGVRLALDSTGNTLTAEVAELRNLLREDPAALCLFDSRLLQAGFHDDCSGRYTRRFLPAMTRTLLVRDGFPRLTRANVAIEIRNARYELDLDLVSGTAVDIESALQQLGVL